MKKRNHRSRNKEKRYTRIAALLNPNLHGNIHSRARKKQEGILAAKRERKEKKFNWSSFEDSYPQTSIT